MREIKFRALGMCKSSGERYGWKYLDIWGFNDHEDYDEETLGQYTGLKDKNGVEIYEGDLVRTGYGDRAVEWGDYSLAWMLDKAVELGHVAGSREVIGNIYE